MGILQAKTVPDGKYHLDDPLVTGDHEHVRQGKEGRTLERTSIGALNGHIEVSQIILMWFSGDPWRRVGDESFCLL